MDALDYYLLDQHLEYYFADHENEQELGIGKSSLCHELANHYAQTGLRAGYIALEDDCSLGLYVGEDD